MSDELVPSSTEFTPPPPNILAIYNLTPVAVDYHYKNRAEYAIFLLDFVRERVYDLSGNLVEDEISQEILNIIKSKKVEPVTAKLPSIPIKLKGERWKGMTSSK